MNSTDKKKFTQMAIDLKLRGYTYAQIGKKLAEAGYVSIKTKKPLTEGGVSVLLHRHGKRTKTAVTRVKNRQTKINDSLKSKAIRNVLNMDNVSAEERIALAQLICDIGP